MLSVIIARRPAGAAGHLAAPENRPLLKKRLPGMYVGHRESKFGCTSFIFEIRRATKPSFFPLRQK